jgi:hypothetical protein
MKMIEILAEMNPEEKTPEGEMCISGGICAAVRGKAGEVWIPVSVFLTGCCKTRFQKAAQECPDAKPSKS